MSFLELMQVLVPVSLLVIVLIIINIIIFKFDDIKRYFTLDKRTAYLLIGIFMLGLLLRIFLVPHMHNVYYDEESYLDQAKYIAEDFKVCSCLWHQDGECLFCGIAFKSTGHILMLGTIFKIIGSSTEAGLWIMTVVASLSVIGLFYLAYFMFRNKRVALVSSLLLALYPLHLRWSPSIVAEITGIFFTLLTFIFLFLYLEHKQIYLLIISVLLLFFTMTVKEELVLLALPFGLLLLKEYKQLFTRKWLIAMILMLIPFIAATIYFHSVDDEYASQRYLFWKGGQILSFDYLRQFFFQNLANLFNTDYTLAMVSVLFVIGLGGMMIASYKHCLGLLAWILAIIALFSAYLDAPLVFSEVRHYLAVVVVVAMIAGFGFETLLAIAKNKMIISSIFVILIIASFAVSYGYISHGTAPVDYVQADYKFMMDNIDKVPKDCTIVSGESYRLDLLGRNSRSFYLDEELSSGCNVFFQDTMCYLTNNEICNRFLNKYSMDAIAETEYGGKVFGFYKIVEKV